MFEVGDRGPEVGLIVAVGRPGACSDGSRNVVYWHVGAVSLREVGHIPGWDPSGHAIPLDHRGDGEVDLGLGLARMCSGSAGCQPIVPVPLDPDCASPSNHDRPRPSQVETLRSEHDVLESQPNGHAMHCSSRSGNPEFLSRVADAEAQH